MRRFLSLVLASTVLALATKTQAELPPSVYEAKQAAAGEVLDIEVVQVEIEPGDAPNQQQVHAVALVTGVQRSKAEVKKDELIKIRYTVTQKPKDFVGPGEIPILKSGEKTIAYLEKSETLKAFTPVAGVMSFSNF